jgi:hypothetical protein
MDLVKCKLALFEFKAIDSNINSPKTAEKKEIEAYGSGE